MKRSAKPDANDDNRLFQVAHPKPTWEREDDVFSSFSAPCRIRIVTNSQVEVVRLDEESNLTDNSQSGKWETRNILFVPVAMQSNANKYTEALQKKLTEEKEAKKNNQEEAEIEEMTMECHNDSNSSDEEKGSDRVKCVICRKLMWAKHLKEHMLTHNTKEKKKLAKKSVFDHRPDSAEDIPFGKGENCLVEASEDQKDTGFICRTCGVSVENLQEHILAHKDVPKNMCAGCGKSFKVIKQHKANCRGQPNCKPCGILFETSAEYTKHLKPGKNCCPSSATVQKRFPCELCELVFFQERRLKRHMVIHTGEKNHYCDLCGKGFGRKDYVSRHKRDYPDGACIEKFGKESAKVTDAQIMEETNLLEVVVTPCL